MRECLNFSFCPGRVSFPVAACPYSFLFSLFRVQFPTDNLLTPEQVRVLKEILPDPDMECDYDSEDVEEVHMSSADLREFGKGGASEGINSADDSDEDGGPQPVQCPQS